jgi:hypothetical protein
MDIETQEIVLGYGGIDILEPWCCSSLKVRWGEVPAFVRHHRECGQLGLGHLGHLPCGRNPDFSQRQLFLKEGVAVEARFFLIGEEVRKELRLALPCPVYWAVHPCL